MRELDLIGLHALARRRRPLAPEAEAQPRPTRRLEGGDRGDTDLKGPFFLAKLAALERIKAGRGGRIINMLSTEIVRPTGMLAAYGAAKAGLMAVTHSIRWNWGQHGILVNAVIPGATMTAERIAGMQSNEMKGPTLRPEYSVSGASGAWVRPMLGMSN